MIKALKF
ncbi:hypothetical protein RDI58_004366 [Solanum bulbocastanum]